MVEPWILSFLFLQRSKSATTHTAAVSENDQKTSKTALPQLQIKRKATLRRVEGTERKYGCEPNPWHSSPQAGGISQGQRSSLRSRQFILHTEYLPHQP